MENLILYHFFLFLFLSLSKFEVELVHMLILLFWFGAKVSKSEMVVHNFVNK